VVRKVLRKRDVEAATGWKSSALYDAIAKGKFPRSVRLDPDSSIVVWLEDEVAEWQKAAFAGKLAEWRIAYAKQAA
jgi:prophage regulatory protein